jgi:hypothetical protein
MHLLKGFESHHFSEFPLCSGCTLALLPRWRFERAYLDDQVRYLANLSIPDARKRCDELERLNQKLAQDAAAFQEVSRQYTTEIERVTRSSSLARGPSDDRLASPQPPQLSAPPSPPQTQVASPFAALTLGTVFHITTKRHYGCINDNRLGTTTPDVVPVDEFDRAIFFLAQLVQAMARMADVQTADLVVGTSVFVSEDGKPVAITSGDLKSRKGLQTFHTGIRRLVAIVQSIFESPMLAGSNFMPPHQIDMEKTELSGDSFIYNKKKPAGFTAAMKFLLFDLKYAQKHAMQSAVRMFDVGPTV